MSLETQAPDGLPSLPRIAQSEAELLNLARALLVPGTRHIRALRQRADRAGRIRKIGPTALGLLRQTLARGVCYQLLARGGWQRRRTLVAGQAKPGRLWQRHTELPALHFGRNSFELLIWLREQDVGNPRRPLPYVSPTSLGDEVLLYLAAEQIVAAEGDLHQEAFLRSPLCQLGFAHALAGPTPMPQLDYRDLARGPGAVIFEALQSDLASRWLETEGLKGTIVSLERMTQLGQAQDQALASLFRSVDLVDPPRRDLCGFLTEVASALLARGPQRLVPDHRWWTRSLDLRASLAGRQAAFSAAAACLRGITALDRWFEEAGLVAHFDEGYETAQLLLSSWASLRAVPEPGQQRALAAGPTSLPSPVSADTSIFERAQALTRELESLHSLGVS